MNTLRLLLTVWLYTKFHSFATSPPIQLMLDFLHSNNIKMCYLYFSCSKHEKVQFSEIFHRHNIRMAFLSPTKLPEIENNLSLGYIIKFNFCHSAEPILNEVAKKNVLFLVDDEAETKFLYEVFQDSNFGINSNTKLALRGILNDYRLFNVFKLGNEVMFNGIGSWSGQNLKTIPYYKERMNLTNVVIRAASTAALNYSGSFEAYMLNPRIRQVEAMGKFHFALFRLLQEIHNFSYTLTVTRPTKNMEPGNINNIIELLKDNKIDISIAGGLQTASNTDVIEYLKPSYDFRVCFLLRHPKKSSLGFLRPFSQHIWYAILIISIIIAILLKISFGKSNGEASWITSIFIVCATLCQEGGESNLPTRTACRLIFSSLLMMSLLLYNYYTSIMVSLLLSPEPEIYHSIEELAQSNFEVAIDDQPYTKNWFYTVNFSDIQHLYKRKILHGGKLNIYPPDEGIAKLSKGGYAYHIDTSTAYDMIAKNLDQDSICDLTEISMIPPSAAGFVVQKKAQFLKLFQISLQRLSQSGMIQRFQMIWQARKPECYSDAEFISFGMEQALPAFLCLATGMLLALLFLSLEIIWVLHYNNTKNLPRATLHNNEQSLLYM